MFQCSRGCSVKRCMLSSKLITDNNNNNNNQPTVNVVQCSVATRSHRISMTKGENNKDSCGNWQYTRETKKITNAARTNKPQFSLTIQRLSNRLIARKNRLIALTVLIRSDLVYLPFVIFPFVFYNLCYNSLMSYSVLQFVCTFFFSI